MTQGDELRAKITRDPERPPTLEETQAMVAGFAPWVYGVDRTARSATGSFSGKGMGVMRVSLPPNLPPQREAEQMVAMIGNYLHGSVYFRDHSPRWPKPATPHSEALWGRAMDRHLKDQRLITLTFCGGWFGLDWFEALLEGRPLVWSSAAGGWIPPASSPPRAPSTRAPAGLPGHPFATA